MADLPYVPIILNFIPAIISQDTTLSYVNNSYRLLIRQEASTSSSSYQALPQETVVTIPTNGVVKLKLLPLGIDSQHRNPINRYRVFYYNLEGELLDEQFWVVPNLYLQKKQTTIYNKGGGIPATLPNNLYDIEAIYPEAIYSIINSLLYFDNSAEEGEYTITYTPGLTLQDLIVER